MKFIDIIGYLAGALTTISFLPQVIQVWKTRSTKDLSIVMFLLFSLGLILWLIYGISVMQLPIILANGFTLLMASIIIVFKIIYK
ncbi:MAG: SemiSWEET transporter [Fibrobacter sp.]|nr:SemiSWEET transporter [Fibrobacter sp.]